MENIELINLQKQEAIERLKILESEYNLHKNVLKEFKEDGTIYYSENFGGFYNGILYWLRNKQDFVNKVKEIEETRNIFVYHCILNHTNFGDLLTMLYVSSDIEYWKDEKEQLKNDAYTYAYVWNMSLELDSEYGIVGIAGVNGGLTRTC
jgi:hypothetical protein